MPLMTRAEVKSVLRITDTTYDSDIDFFLPLVERDIIDYTNNAFQDRYVYRESGNALAFVIGDSDTGDQITDQEEDFVEDGFRSTMDIVVEGGGANVGYYHLSSASTGRLVIDEYARFVPQDQDDTKDDNLIGSIRISRVKWPRALKLTAAKMIWHLISDAKPDDVQSERIGNYSVTFAGSNAYPTRVLEGLRQYKVARLL